MTTSGRRASGALTTLTTLSTLAAATILTGAGAAAGHAGVADATTCRGETPTIVAGGKDDVIGTEGRDVVLLTGRNFAVDTLGGDDLVCAAPKAELILVETGPGDDVVDLSATRSGTPILVVLGGGGDSYLGSRSSDQVYAGEGEVTDFVVTPGTDAERDLIDTGGGEDSVTSGQDGAPNADDIDLGAGDDTLDFRGVQGPEGRVEGGGSDNSLEVAPGPGQSFAVDLATREVTVDAARALAWTGEFTSVYARGPGDVEVVGTDRDEYVEVRDGTPRGDNPTEVPSLGTIALDLAGGDDYALVLGAPAAGGSFDLGRGLGFLILAGEDEVSADLATGRLAVDGEVSRLHDVRSIGVAARTVDVRGDRRANTLSVRACRAQARGRGGDDSLRDSFLDELLPKPDCTPSVVFRGGPGADDISGSAGADRLYGGPGRDRARGGQGRDVCLAEKRRNCERP